ncbi:MAG: cobalamin biosynthesis protein CobW [Acidobacteria bacterium]|nr:cobalamin biosynthesis protein CobW [Acidobacteriota bacterium]
MLEVLIVTGPLGAGKTTAVNRLLKREVASGRRVAVLINEFGAVSVDGALVNAERPELADIADLVGGCACCSLREDVVKTLATWCDQPVDTRPDRIVLETTGLADPSDLVDLELDPALAGRLRVAGVLTVVSALTPLHHLKVRALLRRQVAMASLLHLSKTDLDPSAAMAWESALREAHPALPQVRLWNGAPPEEAPDPWHSGASSSPEAKDEGPSFGSARAFDLRFDHPVDPEALEALFQGPGPGGELLRAKGIVVFDGWPVRGDGSDRWSFQVADGRLEIAPLPLPPSGPMPPCLAVLIGLALDATAWRHALRALERAPAGARKKVVIRAD